MTTTAPGGSESGPAVSEQALHVLSAILKFVFSWIVLTPISVIVAGKLLSQRMKLGPGSKQLFRITLGKVLDVGANDDEVILGFTGFIMTLAVVGLVGGARAYEVVRGAFGIDPGHFNALCVLSAFLFVVWTFLLHLVFLIWSIRGARSQALTERHAQLIDKVSAPGRRS